MAVRNPCGVLPGEQAQGLGYNADLRTRKVVEDVPSIPSIFHESSFPQDHQMLRNVGLPQSKTCLEVTHTLLAIPKDIQNCDTNRMAEGPARVCLGPIVFRDVNWAGHHIQNPEYDSRPRSQAVSVSNITPSV